MTVTEVKGFGTQRGVIEQWQGQEFWIEFLPKIWFLVVVGDEDVEEVVAAICDSAATGEVGDGKIFISEVRDAVRVRTREHGVAALTGGTPVTPTCLSADSYASARNTRRLPSRTIRPKPEAGKWPNAARVPSASS
jgi:nitrogen regulatory protein PII